MNDPNEVKAQSQALFDCLKGLYGVRFSPETQNDLRSAVETVVFKSDPSLLDAYSQAVVAAVEQVAPAVVHIDVRSQSNGSSTIDRPSASRAVWLRLRFLVHPGRFHPHQLSRGLGCSTDIGNAV